MSIGLLKMDLTSEIQEIKFENFEIEFNKMTILTGLNGSGKTLIFKLVSLMSYIGLGHVKMSQLGLPPQTLELAKFLFKNIFGDNDFNGFFSADFILKETNVCVILTLTEGEVTDVEFIGDPLKAKDFSEVNYMSTDFRTFEAMDGYLRTRKLVAGTAKELDPTQINDLLNHIRIYDLKHCELWIQRAPLVLTEEIKTSLKEKFGFKESEIPDSIDVDLDKCKFTATTNGKVRPLYMYAKGQQSLLNMHVTGYLLK